MLEDKYYGYDFRSRQPCIRIGQGVRLDSLHDTKHIDSWLLEHFLIDPRQIAAPEEAQENSPHGLELAVLTRALALYGELFRACGFPCFDKGRVLQIKAVEGKRNSCQAIIALPAIDNLPVALLAKLFEHALTLILNPLNSAPTPKATDALFNELDRAVVKQFSSAVPFGTSTLPICQLAFQQDIPFRHVGNGLIRLGWGARSQLLHSSAIERDSAIGANICNNKQLTAHLLRGAGLPAVEHSLVESPQAAIEAARKLGWPVVVKPSDRERSMGVTVNITTETALLKAYERARSESQLVLVERHVPGLCHRIMVAGGQLIYAVRRLPKGVRGNGRATVAELVGIGNTEQARRPPWKRLKEFPLDEMAIECLSEQGLTPDSVLEEGDRATLRPINSVEWGGDIEELTAQIHPDNVRLAVDAARALGMTVAGVDIMSTDISLPWHENGAVINEMNYMPNFSVWNRWQQAGRVIPALVEGDGRIPVHLVTGEGDLLGRGKQLWSELSKQGRKCHLASASHTQDSEGREILMSLSTLFERSLALTMRPDVEELILIGRGPELFRHGLAVDRLENAFLVDDDAERGERLLGEIRARFPVQSIG